MTSALGRCDGETGFLQLGLAPSARETAESLNGVQGLRMGGDGVLLVEPLVSTHCNLRAAKRQPGVPRG
jgi:hypothetical protein